MKVVLQLSDKPRLLTESMPVGRLVAHTEDNDPLPTVYYRMPPDTVWGINADWEFTHEAPGRLESRYYPWPLQDLSELSPTDPQLLWDQVSAYVEKIWNFFATWEPSQSRPGGTSNVYDTVDKQRDLSVSFQLAWPIKTVAVAELCKGPLLGAGMDFLFDLREETPEHVVDRIQRALIRYYAA